MLLCAHSLLIKEDPSMTYSRSHGAVVLSLSLLLLSACATEQTTTSGGSTSSCIERVPSMGAATQAYDSLQSCLSRIQSGGTAGTSHDRGRRLPAAMRPSVSRSRECLREEREPRGRGCCR
jgi:hypothetical protein